MNICRVHCRSVAGNTALGTPAAAILPPSVPREWRDSNHIRSPVSKPATWSNLITLVSVQRIKNIFVLSLMATQG